MRLSSRSSLRALFLCPTSPPICPRELQAVLLMMSLVVITRPFSAFREPARLTASPGPEPSPDRGSRPTDLIAPPRTCLVHLLPVPCIHILRPVTEASSRMVEARTSRRRSAKGAMRQSVSRPVSQLWCSAPLPISSYLLREPFLS